MSPSYTVEQLAGIVGGTVRGNKNVRVTGVADVAEATAEQAAWVSSPKYAAALNKSRAGVVLVAEDSGSTPMPAILCERVDRSVAKLLGAFAVDATSLEPGVHATAVVHESARMGAGTAIGPCAVIGAGVSIGASSAIHAGVYIGSGTTIGNDCVCWPNVVIRDGCVIGHRVTIHSGAVIGADGLGYYFDEGKHNKVPHIGGVRLEDDVEVGACTCIDRAKFGFTTVGRGTKIDNLVQLAHNVQIGEHCVIAGQCGISGSVRIGDFCVFGGRAGAVDNVAVGDGARLAGGHTIATKDIPAGVTVSGFPARDHRQELREQAHVRRLPALAKLLKDLTARVEQLESSAHHQSRGRV